MNNKYYVIEKNKGRGIVKLQEVYGTTCVWLEGYSGSYVADRLTVIN